MKLFIDSADIAEIKKLHDMGLVDGVTTNPSLIAKSGQDIATVLKTITTMVSGPVSAEVISDDFDGAISEAKILAAIAPNICIKLPITATGLKACATLVGEGVKTNLTLCFSATQALLAAKAGATFVSPFIGRLDDGQTNGMDLIGEIRTIFDNYQFSTQILAASIRSANHVKEAALIGADAATIPAKILEGLVKHPLTDAGLKAFMQDWQNAKQSIAPPADLIKT